MILFGGMDKSNSHFGAAFFATIGIFFLTCKMTKNILYFSRGLSWIAENVFKPKTRFNHIISGYLFIFIGFVILFSRPISSSEKDFFEEIKKTSEFWIAFSLVVLFNISVGVYTAITTKRRRNQLEESPEKE